MRIATLLGLLGLMALGPPSAYADDDLPPPPTPGQPWSGPVCDTYCINQWGGNHALAVFFEQKKCLGEDQQVVIGVSPFDGDHRCVKLDYLQTTDLLPYHKSDNAGHWFDDIPVNSNYGNLAVGLQCFNPPTCGGSSLGSGPGDVFYQTASTVSHSKNNDGGGPGLHVNNVCLQPPNEPGDPVPAGAFQDTREFVDVQASWANVTSGGVANGYEKPWMGTRSGLCPDGNYAIGDDGWFFDRYQYPLKSGLLSAGLLTLVHTQSVAPQDDCHLEQEYFTREMGKVRHEAFTKASCGGSQKQLPSDCNSALRSPGPGWIMYNCSAYVYSAAPLNQNGDSMQKAHDILAQSNLTAVLFGGTPVGPIVGTVNPPAVKQGGTKTLTVSGTFPYNQWFQHNVLVMFDGGGSVHGTSNEAGDTVTFQITDGDWGDDGLSPCPKTVGVRIFDGVSTSNSSSPFKVNCSNAVRH